MADTVWVVLETDHWEPATWVVGVCSTEAAALALAHTRDQPIYAGSSSMVNNCQIEECELQP